ncbi:cytochrome P450 6a2-like [Cylas formicarius]|uniref:cytochrome P450 6a2-like n=2 Tax=Cylas formicarius TaxID=197179 RepID=UPI002958BCBE|nr:cytochrome P450 6a2-like [Cylas formicarius]
MFVPALLILLVGLIIYYVRRSHTYWRRHGVTEIYPIHPIFGNARETFLCNESIYEFFLRIYSIFKAKRVRYGGIYTFTARALVIIDPELIKDIMQTSFDHFEDRAGYINEEREPLTAHLVNLKGAKWKSMRHRLTPTFTSGKMKMMFQTFVYCISGLKGMIEGYARNKESVDIKDVLARFTTDIIGNCAFGIECNSMKDPSSEFRVYGKKVFDRNFWQNAKITMTRFVPKSVINALGIYVTNQEVAQFFTRMITSTIEYREKNNIARRDFLDMLLQLKNHGQLKNDDGVFEQTGVDGSLTLNQIAAQCFVFFLAGFETSSTAMTFALYELSRNQVVQDKLRQEINRVLRKHDGEITYEAVQEMTYLENVIYESMRKFPPVPAVPRTCTKTYRVPNSNVVIEKGKMVNIPIAGLHWDPDYFPDSEKFDPDRFTEEIKATRPHYAYLPFGGGPRNCIGLRFGMLQSKVGVATIIRNFRLTLNSKTEHPLRYETGSFITSVKGDVWLDVERV